ATLGGDTTSDPLVAPPTGPLDCLVLIDLEGDLPLWRGEAGEPRLHTARLTDDGAVEVLDGGVPDVSVLRIAPTGDSWAAGVEAFDAAEWGGAGFGPVYAISGATGSRLPEQLSERSAGRLMADGVLARLAVTEPGGRVIATRI